MKYTYIALQCNTIYKHYIYVGLLLAEKVGHKQGERLKNSKGANVIPQAFIVKVEGIA